MQQFVSVINYEKIYRHCFNSVGSVKKIFLQVLGITCWKVDEVL